MEATSLSSIPKLPLIRRSSTKPSSHNRNGLMTVRKLVVNAKQGENEGKSVDENLIVLRMRIKKMKSREATKDQDHQTRLPSSDRNERETKLFSHDHEDVFEAMKLLQSYFAKTGPGVALGVLALLAMSLPILSQSDFLANVLKVAKVLLAGGHVCIDIDF